MREFLRQYRALLISLALVLAGLHIISSSIDDKTNAGFFGRLVLTIYEPIYKVINFPFGKVGGAVSNYTSVSTIRQEYDHLIERNKELEKKVHLLTEKVLEVQRHANLLSIPENLNFKENKPAIIIKNKISIRIILSVLNRNSNLLW